jgi:hypothetical protein
MALTDGMTPEEIADTDARYGLHVRPETAEWLVAFAAGFKGSKSDRAAFAAVAEAVRASFGDKKEADENGRRIHAAYLPLFDDNGVACDSHMNRVMDVLNKRAGRSKADKEAIMELRTELSGAAADMYTCPREPEIVPAPVVVAVPVETPAPVAAEVPAAPVKAKRVRKAKESAPVETPDVPAPVVADGPTDETRAEYSRLVLITEASQRLVDRARAAGVGAKGVRALADRVSADNLSAQEIDELADDLYPVETPDAGTDVVATPDAVPASGVESAPVAVPDVAPGDVVAAVAVRVGTMINQWSDVVAGASKMTPDARRAAAAELLVDFAETKALHADADGKGTPLAKLDGDAVRRMFAAWKILRDAHAFLSGLPQYQGDRLPKGVKRTFRKAVAPWRADATAALPVA